MLQHAPEMYDLAEELVPRLKALEVATGFPFYVEPQLMADLRLVAVIPPSSSATTPTIPTAADDATMPSVTAALSKILAAASTQSF